MFQSRKLRPDTSILGIGQPILALFIFAIIWAISGITMGLVFMAFVYVLYAIISLISLMRTANPWYMVTLVFQLTIALMALIAPEVGKYSIDKDSFKPLTLIVFVEMAMLVYIMATGKLKWRGREVLELAAMNIDEASNGFTERPLPLGKIECKAGEIRGFAGYLKSHLIAFPIEEDDKTILVPLKMSDEYRLPLGLSKNYLNNTRITIDNQGNVSAVISKKDYLQYKEALSFDLLCESLGKLFIQFFEYYQKGEEVRIMNEISRIKLGPFS